MPGAGSGDQRPQGPDHRGGGGRECRERCAAYYQECAPPATRAQPGGGQQEVLYCGRQGLHLQGDYDDILITMRYFTQMHP